MVDITKCLNEDCVLKLHCYRYTSEAGGRQSYSDFKYDNNHGCDYYWPTLDKENRERFEDTDNSK